MKKNNSPNQYLKFCVLLCLFFFNVSSFGQNNCTWPNYSNISELSKTKNFYNLSNYFQGIAGKLELDTIEYYNPTYGMVNYIRKYKFCSNDTLKTFVVRITKFETKDAESDFVISIGTNDFSLYNTLMNSIDKYNYKEVQSNNYIVFYITNKFNPDTQSYEAKGLKATFSDERSLKNAWNYFITFYF